jgi:hypothetical protein
MNNEQHSIVQNKRIPYFRAFFRHNKLIWKMLDIPTLSILHDYLSNVIIHLLNNNIQLFNHKNSHFFVQNYVEKFNVVQKCSELTNK